MGDNNQNEDDNVQVQRAQAMKEPKIDPFYGKEDEDFKYWFDDFVNITDGTQMSLPRKIALLRRSLKGDARHLYETLNGKQTRTLKGIFDILSKTLCARDEPEDWKVKLRTMKMQGDDSLALYSARIKHAVKRAYPELKGKLESLEVDWFIHGLPKDVAQKITLKKPKTMETVIAIAEEKLAKKRKDTRNKSPVRVSQVNQLETNTRDEEDEDYSTFNQVEAPPSKRQKVDADLSINRLEGKFRQQIKSSVGQINKKMEDVQKIFEEKLTALQHQQQQQQQQQHHSQYQQQQQQYPHNRFDRSRNSYKRYESSRYDARPNFRAREFMHKPRPTGKECYACGKVGHLKRDCRSLNKVNDTRNNNSLN
jgi:hypothetical protein